MKNLIQNDAVEIRIGHLLNTSDALPLEPFCSVVPSSSSLFLSFFYLFLFFSLCRLFSYYCQAKFLVIHTNTCETPAVAETLRTDNCSQLKRKLMFQVCLYKRQCF
jgi:hypothetical protein